jgi:hypothetical protein
MSMENAEATRAFKAAVTRRNIDASRLEVRVIHGTCYCRGILTKLRTHQGVDLNKEMEIITQSMRGRNGIREVVWEVTQRS